MQIIGFLLVIVAVWTAYCGINSFNPITLALAIAQNVQGAGATLAEAHGEVSSATAVDASNVNVSASGGGVQNFSPKGKYGPFTPYTITDSFAAHIARHSTAPGVDFAMPVGTSLVTPFSGIVHFIPNANPLAGNEAQVKLSNGDTLTFMHVSRFLEELNGKHVSAGTTIAYSGGAKGAPGAGDSTGPHVHVGMQTKTGQYVPFYSVPFG